MLRAPGLLCCSLLLAFSLSACAQAQRANDDGSAQNQVIATLKPSPTIIGHRGASGYRPEHTLESYELAIEQGADFIEPDLVMTKDGVLITRHENEISGTTDVAVKFPKRKTTKTIDGTSITGWFTEDFTLAEIRSLRAKERLSFRDQSYNGKFQIPTFEDVLELRDRKSHELGRQIGIYPEMKHPSYFTQIGLPLAPSVATALAKHGLDQKSSPVFVQAFELTALRELKKLIDVKTVFLLDAPHVLPPDHALAGINRTYGSYLNPEGMAELRLIVDGIGPAKEMILMPNKDGKLGKPTPLIPIAHAAGLLVHPYTFRSDKSYLPAEYNGDPIQEYKKFFALGVDGVFSDFPDQAVKARVEFEQENSTQRK